MLHGDEQLLNGNEYNKVMSRSRVRRLFQKEVGQTEFFKTTFEQAVFYSMFLL